MTIRINKKLNLVLPVDLDETRKAYVHSMPLSREAFEANYLVLSKTFTAIYGEGLGPVLGPRVAMLMMKEQAENLGASHAAPERRAEAKAAAWEYTQTSLINEIYRLTSVVLPGAGGWDIIPYTEALKRDLFDDEQVSEVENAIVYFTVASALHRKNELPMAFDGLKSMWNAQTTLSNVTAFKNSLQTSTQVETTGPSVTEPSPMTEKVLMEEAIAYSIPS
jgi:hypothetical protein